MTVLALQAVVAYGALRAKPKSPGDLQRVVDGQPVSEPVKFEKDTQGAIELANAAEQRSPGKHLIEIRMKGGSEMPYSMAVDLHREKPDSSAASKLYLQFALNDEEIEEGAATEARVVVVNRSDERAPSPIAIIGVPGGLEVCHDQLKEFVKQDKIAACEVIGREVVLYWRVFDAEQRVELPIGLIAAIPGQYTGPANRAYLYYTDEHKEWTSGMSVRINARGGKWVELIRVAGARRISGR